MEPIRFVVYSDYLCPWCYNVSVRMHRLRAAFDGRVELEWKSYLLRPRSEPGRDLEKFREYTRSWMRPGGEDDGGSFRVWESDEGPPTHSVPPHLVAKAAARVSPDAFDRMHDRLLRAYFAENRDISQPATLRELWAELELPPDELSAADDPEVLKRVIDEHNEALECGTGGVPAVRLSTNDAVITGAHPYAFYERWAERALAAAETASTA